MWHRTYWTISLFFFWTEYYITSNWPSSKDAIASCINKGCAAFMRDFQQIKMSIKSQLLKKENKSKTLLCVWLLFISKSGSMETYLV